MITPTIGRKVWFYKGAGQPEMDATVVDVHGDRMVSLYVVSRTGQPSFRPSVTLLQDNDPPPAEGSFAAWMPYQRGQAARQVDPPLLLPEESPAVAPKRVKRQAAE